MAELGELAGCSLGPTTVVPSAEAVFEFWSECVDGVRVELYTMLGGRHEWQKDASAVLIDFFDAR